MNERGTPKSPEQAIFWHLNRAAELLKRLFRPAERDLAAADGAKHLPTPVTASSAPSDPSGSEAFASAESIISILRQQRLEAIQQGDFLTNDLVEIRGGLGAKGGGRLRINGRPALELKRREHAVLLILANYARYVFLRSQKAARNPSAYLPAAAVAMIIGAMNAEGGPLSGLWPYPTDTDVHRSVSKLRGRLSRARLNASLIESGPRGAGYRLSTPMNNLHLPEEPANWEELWVGLFDAALRGTEDRGSQSGGGQRRT